MPKMASPHRPQFPVNALTVDVEDYFQVEAFAQVIDRKSWDDLPHRVERNTEAILDLFAAHDCKATFFTLGWVAERYPGIIRRIVAEGHELASHGYGHRRAIELTPDEFREDVSKAKTILEDLGGVAVNGYRAPSFSIVKQSLWAHQVLADAGYIYSSSVNPIRHDLYGMPDAPRVPYHPLDGRPFLEIPITTLDVMGRTMPCGGGGFFRLFPYAWFRTAWRKINSSGQPFLFYFHPWEIDPDQPRQADAPLKSRFRHYARLNAMEHKIANALEDFAWGRMDDVYAPHILGSKAA
jgi:polysaccharide deacetylase family protein (PEP-CTERM system associated)